MIASVSGEVLHKGLDHVVVEAGGVGYLLSVSEQTLAEVAAPGRRATLLAALVVREDSMQLFGFSTGAERDLFGLLTGVSGVGPKVALAVLSAMSVNEAETALVTGDHARFQKVPGIGRRTAERLIVELKDKVVPSGTPSVTRVSGETAGPVQVAHEALIGLGFTDSEAEQMLQLASGESTEDLVASALRGTATR